MSINEQRIKAYKRHVIETNVMNARLGTDYNPRPYSDFQWRQCVLCNQEIRDDPFGHNPAPLADDGYCCSKCNSTKVVHARMLELLGSEDRVKLWECTPSIVCKRQ